jgi:phosphoribosyl-AMP cyclohydrolase
MMSDHHALEEGLELNLDFGKIDAIGAKEQKVIPVAVQNIDTKEVILVAYANELALKTSMETKTATFWSTSRNELWIKGATSGATFDLLEVLVNCDQNSLVYKVRPRHGGICHTKNKKGAPRNCYYRSIDSETGNLVNTDQ